MDNSFVDPYDDVEVFWTNFYYGWDDIEEEEEVTHPAEIAPKPPKELTATPDDLNKVLHVKGHSFNIPTNTKLHKTDEYECTTKKDKLVVRRGGNFTLTLDFDRPFSLASDDIKLVFKTGGVHNKQDSCTNGQFLVDETGKKEHEANKWSGKLVKKEGNKATIDVHIAANCAIGNWTFEVTTFYMEDGKKRQVTYAPVKEFCVLFNPWCKDDTTFMPDSTDLNEYVLDEHGYLYRGSYWNFSGKTWEVGQFEEVTLDAALYLLNSVKAKVATRSNPVKVARNLTRMVNAPNDNGVLVGNWSGEYADGTSPGAWNSSVDILRQYMEKKEPVKYGQCWVFSAVLTTLCRTLGLPARSVTNFASAHDTDVSCSIDTYFDEDGEEIAHMNGDSVWNFHVWNETWFQRPDIPVVGKHPKGCFDGWQVIDATPQETSNEIVEGRSREIYTCGPSPVYAIKRGMVTMPFDTAFVFAEINGDKIEWTKQPNGEFTIRKLKSNAVGKFISCKKPAKPKNDGEEPDLKAVRLDLTDEYKFADGSVEDRQAKATAALGSESFNKHYLAYSKKPKNIKIKLKCDPEGNLGDDLVVRLNASHKAVDNKNSLDLTDVTFRFRTQDYRGRIIGEKPFLVVPQAKKTLKPNEDCFYEMTLKYKDYKKNLGEGLCMSIQAMGHVMEGSTKVQFIAKRCDYTWKNPDLKVEFPASVTEGEEFEAVVSFKSSLPETIHNCMLCVSRSRYIGRDESRIVLDDIPGNGEFEVKVPLKALKAKPKAWLMFTLIGTELTDLGASGAGEMEIKKLE